MIDVRSFTISVLPEPEEIIIPDYSTVEEQQPIVTTPATSRRAAAKSYRYPNKVSKVSAAGKKSPVLVVPEPNTSTKLKTPSSRNARAKNRDPVKTKSRKVKPRQSGMFKRFTLLVIGYIRERDLYGPEGSPILLMLTMISVSQKTICLMWYWGSMSSALSLKKRAKFNREGEQARPDAHDCNSDYEEITRFPSRPLQAQSEPDQNQNIAPPKSPEQRTHGYYHKLKPQNSRHN